MAFPTTSILDNANRANEDPLSGGGNWGGPIFSGMAKMKVVSNAFKQSTLVAGQSGSSFWNAATFGPGVEVYCSVTTMWSNDSSDIWLWANGNTENAAGVDGNQLYIFQTSGVFTWQLYRVDNGVGTQLGANIGSQTISNGDSIGLEIRSGGTWQCYYKASGGSWATTGTTRSDNTYTSGHIGFSKGFQDTTSVLDDFGGGTLITAYTLAMGAGSYSLTGSSVSTLYNRLLSLGSGSYALTGQALSTLYNRLLSIGSGSYAVTGTATNLLFNRLLSLNAGSYTLTGQDISALYARIFSLGAGSYVLFGQDANTLYNRLIQVSPGSYVVNGQDLTPLYGRIFPLGSGAYLITGSDLTMTVDNGSAVTIPPYLLLLGVGS